MTTERVAELRWAMKRLPSGDKGLLTVQLHENVKADLIRKCAQVANEVAEEYYLTGGTRSVGTRALWGGEAAGVVAKRILSALEEK